MRDEDLRSVTGIFANLLLPMKKIENFQLLREGDVCHPATSAEIKSEVSGFDCLINHPGKNNLVNEIGDEISEPLTMLHTMKDLSFTKRTENLQYCSMKVYFSQ